MKRLRMDVRRHLKSYLAGDINLQALQDWFIPAAWDASGSCDTPTSELIHAV